MQLDTLIQDTMVSSKSLIGLFEARVESYPDKIAIFHNDESITYRDLNNQANAVAGYLIKLGIGENYIVGVLMERNINLIVAMLGVLKAGAAYAIIDPDYPIGRIEYILKDINTGLLLTDEFYKNEEKYQNLQTFHSFQYICIAELLVHSSFIENLDLRSNGDTLACVIYTSGSTGKPKGVLLEHKAFFRLFNGPNMVQTTSSDCVAQISSASFDGAIHEIWAALGKGGSLVIIDKDITLSPTDLERCFRKYKVTVVILSVGLFNQLVKTKISIFKSLKSVIFVGEAANPEIVRTVINNKEFKPEKLFNGYGPTECGIGTTYYEIKTLDDNAVSVPIGSPINDTQIYIFDDDLKQVTQGEIGELYIVGEGLARGYLNLPHFTAEKFIRCPFDVNSRMYATGDLVKMLPDRILDFVGRKDNQVKIRGHRIELEEIEHALEVHFEIWKAVVVAPYTQQGHRQLIAYFVSKGKDKKVMVESIKFHLKKILPDYMIPGIIVQLDFLPLTSHGKIDRQKLSQMSLNEEIKVVDKPFNLTEIEKILLEIWKNILGFVNIRLSDSFFDLGGDSIMIMQMIVQAADNGIALNYSIILQHPTIQSLAHLIRDKKNLVEDSMIFLNKINKSVVGNEQNNSIDVSLTKYSLKQISKQLSNMKNIQAIYPLTSIQKSFLYCSIYNKKSHACFIQTYWHSKGKYNAGAMREAWETLLSNRDLFRASYLWEELDDPIQIIYKKAKIILTEEDWSFLLPEEQEIKLKEYWKKDVAFGIDLKKDQLMRVLVIQLSDNKQLIIWSFHHIIMDGLSLCGVIEELDYYYYTLCLKKDVKLKQVTPYRDFIDWQYRYNQDLNKLFWKKYLNGFTSPNQFSFQKCSRIDILKKDNFDSRFDRALSMKLSRSLYQYAMDNKLTLNIIVQGIWAYLLSIYCNTEDIIFGFTISTRPAKIKNVDSIAGPLINILPFRVIINKEMLVIEYFKFIQSNLASVIDHSHYSYLDIQEDFKMIPDNGFFNSYFCFESQKYKELENRLSAFHNIRFNATTPYAFSLYVTPGTPIELKVNFDNNLFSREDLDKLIDHYICLMSNLVKKNNHPLNQLDY